MLIVLGAPLSAQTPPVQTPPVEAPPAQTPQDSPVPPADQILASYEGQTVTSVAIAGRPELETSQFQSQLVQKSGEPFAKQKIDATLAALKATGKFENVRVQVEPVADGLHVLFVLDPAVYYGIFQFPGAERFPYARLIQSANYVSQAPYDATAIESDRQRLLRFYRQEGYFQAQIVTQLRVDSKHGVVDVIFASTLGPKARFGDVAITGVPDAQAKDLQLRLATTAARIRGAAVRPGRSYNRSTLNKAANYLQSRLQKESYLAAQVRTAGAEYHADTNRADIRFRVNPGTKTLVTIDGAHIWPWTKKSLLPEYQGVGIDDETLEEGRQALVDYFRGKGYFNVKVTSELNGSDSLRTVVYRIAKEKKHNVTDVRITGTKELNAADLMPQVAVQKKHFLSHGRFNDQLVRAGKKNLLAVYQSKGFSSVQVTSSVANRNGDVQVAFNVVEGPRDTVASLTIDGASTFPESQFAPRGLKVTASQPYSQANVEADRAGIMAEYFKAGYLTASFRETASQVSKSEPHRINVIYHIYEGPRVFTAGVVTLGRDHTQQRLIDRDVADIHPDQPLTETKIFTASSNLYNHSGVFDWAEVDPKRQITTQTSEDVLVKVHEAKRNEFTYGFGFELIRRGGSIPGGTAGVPNLPPIGLPSDFKTSETTFYGPRGSFQYTRNNLRGKGESLSITGSPDASINALPSTTSTPPSAGPPGKPPPRSPPNAMKRIPSSPRGRKPAAINSSDTSTALRKISSSLATASAKPTSPALRFPTSFPPPISTFDSRASPQISLAIRATTPLTRTRASSTPSKSISTPSTSAPASISQSSPRRPPSTKRNSITSSGPAASASGYRSPTPTAAFPSAKNSLPAAPIRFAASPSTAPGRNATSGLQPRPDAARLPADQRPPGRQPTLRHQRGTPHSASLQEGPEHCSVLRRRQRLSSHRLSRFHLALHQQRRRRPALLHADRPHSLRPRTQSEPRARRAFDAILHQHRTGILGVFLWRFSIVPHRTVLHPISPVAPRAAASQSSPDCSPPSLSFPSSSASSLPPFSSIRPPPKPACFASSRTKQARPSTPPYVSRTSTSISPLSAPISTGLRLTAPPRIPLRPCSRSAMQMSAFASSLSSAVRGISPTSASTIQSRTSTSTRMASQTSLHCKAAATATPRSSISASATLSSPTAASFTTTSLVPSPSIFMTWNSIPPSTIS